MNIRHFALTAVLSALCGVAGAQGFSSVSSPVPPPDRPAPAVAAPAPVVAAPAPVVVGSSASQPAAQAFSSVSTPQSVATNAGAAAGAGPLLPFSGSGPSSAFEIADRIVIEKGARRLRLLRGGNVIGEYPVKLGLNPYGHKQREGDFRTPEGTYHLSRRNPRSEFFLSVEVSYPNAQDRARAAAGGRPARRPDHDPRPAQRAAQDARLLREQRLDRRLHRGQQLRHGGHLAEDHARHADRDPPMMRHAEVSIPAAEEQDSVDARVTPTGSLENLSQQEVDRLLDSSRGGLYELYRRCSLAVLNSGGETDDARAIFERHADFDIRIVRKAWGIKLDLRNAPASAFVDGRMIRGIQEHLFAVLRDILYIHGEVYEHGSVELTESQGITNAVYRILRNAGLLRPRVRPDLVVCWGGHSISREEYDYTKKVGYELGLRGLNVCTGCGPGAMKGPMKGATIGHSKQRIRDGRYIGLTEPGIVAAEPPNAIVNQLVILPDIEKRLEAFVRTGHGIVVFPGGAGTAEEILYLLGILLDPDERAAAVPGRVHGAREQRGLFPPDRRVPRRDARADRAPVLPDRARRPGRGRPRDAARHGRACANSAAATATPTTSTGCSASRTTCSSPSSRRTRRWPRSRSAATCRRTGWPRSCAARSPASSPATSRNPASGSSRSTGRSRSTATPSCCGRSTRCSRRSCGSGA